MSALEFLLLEANLPDAEVVQATLREGGIDCELLRVDTRAAFIRALESNAIDLILADYALSSFDEIAALTIARRLRPKIPFIFISGSLGEELAIEAIKQGATDYVLKQRLGRLVPSVQRALQEVPELDKDTIDRKQAEVALRVSEERLQTAQKAGNVGVWDWDAASGKTYWSETMWTLYGYEPQPDKMGDEIWESSQHPEDQQRIKESIAEFLASNEIDYRGEFRIIQPNGSVRWIEVVAQLIRDATGKPVRMSGVNLDISDRKRAEASLRESEEKFRTLANTAPALIWYNDAQGNNLFINQYFLDFTGKSAEQIRGEGWHNLVHPDDAELYIADYLAAVREQRSWHNRNRIRRHDGVWRWHDNYAQPLFAADGVYLGHVGVTIDNTDAIEAQKALRESEEKFRTFLSVASDIIYEMSADWREMHFLKGKEFIATTENSRRNWTEEYILETDKPQVWAAINQAIATRSNFELEHRVIRLDGTVGWTFSRAIPLINETGEIVKWFGAASDITEQKQAEAALRESEQQQAFLLKFSDALRAEPDADAVANRAIRMLFEQMQLDRCYIGVYRLADDRGDFTHQVGNDRVPPLPDGVRLSDFPESLRVAFDRTLVINDIAEIEGLIDTDRQNLSGLGLRALVAATLRKGENNPLWSIVSVSAHPRRWTRGEIALVEEVTERTWAAVERVRAEAALRDSEQRLSVIFAQAAVGLSEISLDGYFEQVNDALCRMLERSRQELLAATVPDITHPEDVPKTLDALAQLLETGESISLDKRYLRPDGTDFWANSILTRLDDEQGQPRHILAVTVDLNDRKQAEAERLQRIQEQAAHEEERQRAETLAELDRAKTLFLGNVSHEFRTPLTLSLAPLQDALSDSANPLTQKQRERLQLAHRNSLRLLKLVNTLLDFSRIEADRLKANYEPTDLSTYTAELASVFRSAIENANLQLVVDCPPLPNPIYVDREMWEKIVLNLLSNALKFTFEGMISVLLKPKANTVELMVSDTGIGISASELPHLFERFYQVKGAKGRSYEGSGIGLSLVQDLVKQHGGAIAVTSAVDQGTTFTVTIPTGIAHLPADQIWVASTLASSAVTANAFVEEASRWLPEQEEGGRGHTSTALSTRGAGETALDETSEVHAQSSEVHAQSSEVQAQSSEVQAQSSKRARILLVDDNADMRGYLRRLLNQYYEVEAVNDGLAALTAIRSGGSAIYDLVLADVMMPRMDGFELLRSLRASPNTQTIPIILLSARAGEESRVEGLETGADDYLIKPFSARELLARVNANLQLAQLRREAVYREQVMQAVQTLNERLEQQVKTRTAQLEAINQELEAFSSSISHDLRTPLRYISSFAEQLQGKLNATLVDASCLQALNIITKSALQAEKMVDDLLEFSRLGQTEMYLTTVNITQLVQEVQAQLQPELVGRSLNWEIEPLPTVEADPTLLRLVLQNLLSNAVKYTRNNTEAAIKVGSIEQEQSVIFFVKDNGAGFDMKYCDRLFTIFQRLHPQEEFPGTGVGLATVRRIIHRHGGRIWAEGAIDQGATFYFSLPKRESE